MNTKKLSAWLKCILATAGLLGLIIYAVVIPVYGNQLRILHPEFSNRYFPWLIFLWLSGIPCFAVLILSWKIASAIGKDKSFTLRNAGFLRWISILAAADAGFFFAGNVVLFLFGMSHPGVLLASLIIVFAGIAVSVTTAVLSCLVEKAARLQEQSDLTI